MVMPKHVRNKPTDIFAIGESIKPYRKPKFKPQKNVGKESLAI